jgi:hypothetical protein
MADSEREDQARKYFLPTPARPDKIRIYQQYFIAAGVLVLGLILPIILPISFAVAFLVGAFIAALLALVAWITNGQVEKDYERRRRRAEPKATDQQMDNWLRADQEAVSRAGVEALNRWSEDLSEPLVVIGPDRGAYYRVGEDGVIRFSRYTFLVLMLANRHLTVFDCHYNFVTATMSSPRLYECRQSDLVGIGIERAKQVLLHSQTGHRDEVAMEVLTLTMKGGHSMSVPVDVLDGGERVPTTYRTARAAMRELRSIMDGNGG